MTTQELMNLMTNKRTTKQENAEDVSFNECQVAFSAISDAKNAPFDIERAATPTTFLNLNYIIFSHLNNFSF